MTTLFKFANFVATELEEGISAGATEMIIPVAASEDLPTLSTDEVIRLVLWDGQNDPEIVTVTDNPQTGVLTIERGAEGTTAISWEAGTQVRCTLTAEIINAALAAFFDLEDVLEQTFLPLAGGTLTGALTLPGDPSGALEAATKGYVDTIGGAFLPTTGGTMQGNINMGSNQVLGLPNPSTTSSAARKQYVDDLIASVQSQIEAGSAAHTTSGTGSAYTITTGGGLTVPSHGMTFTIIPHVGNEDDATLQVDSMSPIILAAFGDSLSEDTLEPDAPYLVMYSSVTTSWMLYNIVDDAAIGSIAYATMIGVLGAPSGTTLMFLDAAVPAGWTQNGSFNDKVLRLRSTGGGGGTGGTWTISGLTHAHTHNISGSTGNGSNSDNIADTGSGTQVMTDPHTHSMNFTSGAASTSAVSADGNWRPAYVDSIVGDKD